MFVSTLISGHLIQQGFKVYLNGYPSSTTNRSIPHSRLNSLMSDLCMFVVQKYNVLYYENKSFACYTHYSVEQKKSAQKCFKPYS